jgi:hypothetical protein
MPRPRRQAGLAAVEFAIVSVIFFTFIFGVIELARAMYICNTLQEATRRAAVLAAKTDFTDSAKMQQVREAAIFRDSPGSLSFGDPITEQHIKIDYMSIARTGSTLTMTPIPSGALPSTPAGNRLTCMRDPNDPSCIRLVRVRVCQPGGGNECDPVPYQSIVSLITLAFNLPTSTTIMNAETLGLAAGLPPG